MTLPDYQTLMRPLLAIAAKGETSIPQAEPEIVSSLGISEEDRQLLLPSGKQRILHNRMHWAKFYMSRAGLVQSPKRGRFAITDAGLKVLASPGISLDTQYLLSLPDFAEWYNSSHKEGGQDALSETIQPSVPIPEEIVEAAFKVSQDLLRNELLDRILQNSPAFFEQVIVELLVAMGYGGSRKDAAQRLGQSGDGGVDGVISEDILGLDRIYVQAKRYSAGIKVSRPDVQGFTGSLVGFGASKGVFVTTSTFSQHAIEFAEKIPQRVILIDGRRLTELMVEFGVGVRRERILEFKRIDEDFFTEE